MHVWFLLGLTWDSISSCVCWMAPFVRTVNEFGQPKLKDFKKVAAEDRHNIQTHVDYLSMLVSVTFSLKVLLFPSTRSPKLWTWLLLCAFLERCSAATAGEPGPTVSSGSRRPVDSTKKHRKTHCVKCSRTNCCSCFWSTPPGSQQHTYALLFVSMTSGPMCSLSTSQNWVCLTSVLKSITGWDKVRSWKMVTTSQDGVQSSDVCLFIKDSE